MLIRQTLILTAGFLLSLSLAYGQITTEVVSLNSLGEQPNNRDWIGAVSSDGRYVLFGSDGRDMVDLDGDGVLDPDINGDVMDIFVRDRLTGRTEIINVNSAGEQDNSTSGGFRSAFADMSADARYVTFSTGATNMVDSDGDGVYDDDMNGPLYDVFVRDRMTGVTELVSVNSVGEQANGSSAYSTISADGRYVVFSSQASNLIDLDGDGVMEPDVNGVRIDMFLHDRMTGVTELISVNSAGEQGNWHAAVPGEVTPDGRYVAFVSASTNLVDIDGDGVIDSDVNGIRGDVFVRDRVMGVTELVHINSAGEQGTSGAQPVNSRGVDITPDGRFVLFETQSTNMVDIDGDGVIDTDVNGQEPDLFLRDRVAGITELVSLNSAGQQANRQSIEARFSEDARFIAFRSVATNLVDLDGNGVIDPDTNGDFDIFLRDRDAGVTETISVNSAGDLADNGSYLPRITPDGRFVAFTSDSNNLIDSDGDGVFDDDQTFFSVDVYVRGPSLATTGNEPPTAVPDILLTDEDVPLSFPWTDLTANDLDADGDTLSVRSVSQTGNTNGSVMLQGSTVTYTPEPDYHGPAGFEYIVDDGKGGSAAGTVQVTVFPVNDAPVAVAGPAVGECTFQRTATVMLDATGSLDVDGDALTWTWSAPGIVFDDPASSTPSALFQLGSTEVQLIVSDGLLLDSITVDVQVVDTTAPQISARLVDLDAGSGEETGEPGGADRRQVVFTVTDGCAYDPEYSALLETRCSEIPVVNGQVVEYRQDTECRLGHVNGVFRFEAPALVLRVTARDGSGNESTVGINALVSPRAEGRKVLDRAARQGPE